MTSYQISRAIFLSCLLLAFSSMANAQVVQCIDEAGAVTFADVPCKTDEDAARGAGSIEASRLETRSVPRVNDVPPEAKNFAIAEEIRAAAWAKRRPAKLTFALDIAMLKAAQALMITTQSERKQALTRPATGVGAYVWAVISRS